MHRPLLGVYQEVLVGATDFRRDTSSLGIYKGRPIFELEKKLEVKLVADNLGNTL